MTAALTAVLGLAMMVQTGTDTTLSVRRGMRLDLRHGGGEVVVDTWNRDEVRLTLERDDRTRLEVDARGSVLSVRAGRGRRGGLLSVVMPAYLDVSINGLGTDVQIDGAASDVSVETLNGDIALRGGSGLITLHTQNGDIRLTDARGDVVINTGSGDVTVRRSVGDFDINTIAGEVDLRGLEANRVAVQVVSGEIVYDGTIAGDGRYALASHSGDVTLIVPPGAGATVQVVTYSGAFETSFPVTLQGSRQKQFEFVIGDGRAAIRLETFSGDVFLRRNR